MRAESRESSTSPQKFPRRDSNMASMRTWRPKLTTTSTTLFLLGLVLSAAIVSAQEAAQEGDQEAEAEAEAATPVAAVDQVEEVVEAPKCNAMGTPCKAGVVLPIWRPDGMTLGGGDKAARAVVYFAGLIFLFLGISIISDKFMSAIETITSQEKDVKVKLPNGEVTVITVAIWNETVSNLTLMALGSSAPEILLSVIEIFGSKFVAGDLGPGTIVGSAAFNLFVIIGICILVIPDGEVRYQKHLPVFICTATWSIWAYVWLYLIIAVISPNRVDIWEAVLTLIYFPLTVMTAYICDQQIFFKKFIAKRYRAKGTTIIASEGDVEMQENSTPEVQYDDPQVAEFEKQRAEYIAIMRDLRKKNPDAELEQIEAMAQNEMMNKAKKSRAYYRIAATRKITGGGAVKRKEIVAEEQAAEEVEEEVDNITRIFFDPGHYSVMENCGSFQVTVTREGGDLSNTVYVDYRTEDGTANAGGDYEYAEGTLVFHPTETHKQFSVSVMDDDVFEEDEHFYIRLSNIRVGGSDGMFKSVSGADAQVQLANPSFATVLILDDDHAGFFGFDTREIEVVESIGEVQVKFTRASGARGKVNVPFRCIEGSAKAGSHFEDVSGEISFDDNQFEQFIKIGVVDEEVYEKNMYFAIEVDEPKWAFRDEKAGLESLAEEEKAVAELGAPRLGEITKLIVRIRESKEFKGTVDKLLKKTNMSLMVGASSWKDQFIEAFSVSAGDDDDEGGDDGEEAEEALPSCMDYTMHFLTFFWKLAFATVPPCEYWSGWACFVVSIIQIGLCTAVVGDVASHLGCTIGLKDTVTAITFVALGTSVPDTFASKVAAVQDEYADSSIGNVTGSNGVNVFLGIGVAWSMAAIYHWAIETPGGFKVSPGSLGFCLTIFCILACLAIVVLVIRRAPAFGGGELGGPEIPKKISACIFFGFWIVYVLLSALEQYCHIEGF